VADIPTISIRRRAAAQEPGREGVSHVHCMVAHFPHGTGRLTTRVWITTIASSTSCSGMALHPTSPIHWDLRSVTGRLAVTEYIEGFATTRDTSRSISPIASSTFLPPTSCLHQRLGHRTGQFAPGSSCLRAVQSGSHHAILAHGRACRPFAPMPKPEHWLAG